MFKVRWRAGDSTWLPYDKVEHLEPLKTYFEAIGIDNINKLPDQPRPPPTNDPQVLLGTLFIGIGTDALDFGKCTLDYV